MGHVTLVGLEYFSASAGSSLTSALLTMGSPFQSRAFQRNSMLRKHPTWFGIPFVLLIVAASFGLGNLTQTRYDLHNRRVTEACQRLHKGHDIIDNNYAPFR